MPRSPRKKAIQEEAKPSRFIEALRFLSNVTKEVGPPQETHSSLHNKTATAWNGVIAAGATIDEDIKACPNNKLLLEALSKCGDHISITQLDNNRLSIKSNKFKALVPCIDFELTHSTEPDKPIAVIDDRLKKAFDAVSELVTKDSQNVVTSSILLNGKSLISTNTHILFEYWHGIDLPSGLAIPKDIVAPLIKYPLPLSRFGFSENSVTFWFENGWWLKSQLYSEEWPDLSKIFNNQPKPMSFPADFWEALDAVSPFSEDSFVYFDQEIMRSHPHESLGASFECPGLPKGPIYSHKYLKLIKAYAKEIDWFVPGPHNDSSMAVFFGESMRGALIGRIGSAPDGYEVQ